MKKDFLISINELENTSYNALESLKYDEGFCITVSRSLAFLEKIGMTGITQFVEFLLNNKNSTNYGNFKIIPYQGNSQEKKIAKKRPHLFDGGGKSCIYYIEICIQYISTQINPDLFFSLIIKNSFDHIFLIAYLENFYQRPSSIEWYDEKTKLYKVMFISLQRKFQLFSKKANKVTDPIAKIFIYKDEKDFLSSLKKYLKIDGYKNKELRIQSSKKNLKKGIAVSKKEWEIIKNFAQNVLVPNNEISQQGAGAAQNIIDREDLIE